MYLAGFTWAELGRMLGVTRQAARQRFGSDVEAGRAGAGAASRWLASSVRHVFFRATARPAIVKK